jgi:hypothetical protein
MVETKKYDFAKYEATARAEAAMPRVVGASAEYADARRTVPAQSLF